MRYHPSYEFMLNVSAEQAWNLLEDFENYSEWNSMITFNKKLVAGKSALMNVSIMGRKILTPINVLTIEDNKELRWQGGPKGLFTGEHYFLIEAIDDNSCKMIQGEIFKGLLAPIMLPFLKKTLNTLYEQTNLDIQKALS